MSDYNQIDGAALDRYITGNYGEDQFKGFHPCPECDEAGEVVAGECLCAAVERDEDECYEKCSNCDGEGFVEDMMDPGDDPDRKYDEERDRRMLSDGEPS